MIFPSNIKAFFKKLPLKEMTGQQKFLAAAVFICQGKSKVVNLIDVRGAWKKSLFLSKYSPVLNTRAQAEDWIEPLEVNGKFKVTSEGFAHIATLMSGKVVVANANQAGSLLIFRKNNTHAFDKFLRSIFAGARLEVIVADSWVDETIFDNVLDSIPKSVKIRLIYANAGSAKQKFITRAKRFSRQYSFNYRHYSALHDRAIIVDGVGYIIGPSIKDAATNSPALVVQLGPPESRLLKNLLDEFWKNGT